MKSNSRFRRFVVLSAWVGLSCSAHTAPVRPSASAAPPAAAVVQVASPPRTTPIVHKDACVAAKEIAQRTIATANAEEPKLTAFDPEVPVTGRCYPSKNGKGGTWAVVLTSLTARTDEGNGAGVTGTFELFHTDTAGVLVTATPPPPKGLDANYKNVSGDTTIELHEPVVFDFDGDGSDEIVIFGSGGYHEGESFTFGSVWTFRNGSVVPYPPAASLVFDDVKDVTLDGRPDLLFWGPFDSVVESPCSGFSFRVTGPLFALHSKPDGTFSSDDAEARAFAKTSCPAKPSKFVVVRSDDHDIVDEMASFENIACARAWGVPTPTLRAAIRNQCQAHNPHPECGSKVGECAQQTAMLAWAAQKAPVTLQR